MKKKIKFIPFVYILLFLSQNLIAQDWFPLNLGNKWQYIQIVHGPENFVSNFLFENDIDEDTLIGGDLYYSLIYNNIKQWFRYDEINEVVYVNYEGTDYVYMDFSLSSGEQFQHYFFNPEPQLVIATVIDGQYESVDSSFYYKGYNYIIGYGGDAVIRTTKMVKGIGIISEIKLRAGAHSNETDTDLIQTELMVDTLLVYFKQSYFPKILFVSDSTTNSAIFDKEVTVNHYFSRLDHSIFGFDEGVNFIDSVYIISHYSRSDSVITNPIYYGSRIPVSYKYHFNFELDTALMKNNFVFNYKIKAVDKFWIANVTYLPVNGYFNLEWDSILTIYDDDLLTKLDYSLSQNYPNPFNPSTIISWQSPIGSWQTLKIYDVLGNEVATLVDEYKPAGIYEIEFDGTGLTSGVYFYRIKAGNFIETKKMVLLR